VDARKEEAFSPQQLFSLVKHNEQETLQGLLEKSQYLVEENVDLSI
jgi:hypothetical protein